MWFTCKPWASSLCWGVSVLQYCCSTDGLMMGVFVNTPTIWRSLRESQTPCLPAPWRCARQGHLAYSTRPVYWKRYPIPLHCLAYNTGQELAGSGELWKLSPVHVPQGRVQSCVVPSGRSSGISKIRLETATPAPVSCFSRSRCFLGILPSAPGFMSSGSSAATLSPPMACETCAQQEVAADTMVG